MTEILLEIRQLCDRIGMTKSAFGLKAVRDRNLVTDLEKGRVLRPSTLSRVRRFIKRSTPKGEASEPVVSQD